MSAVKMDAAATNTDRHLDAKFLAPTEVMPPSLVVTLCRDSSVLASRPTIPFAKGTIR
jgi:hypothetical protein